MKDYKQWTAKERYASLKLTKKAIADGTIPPATKCCKCRQEKGIIQYHNEDYSDPIKFLLQLCWRCHMILHSQYRNPEACRLYWERIAKGEQDAPVYKHDFNILLKDYGIE